MVLMLVLVTVLRMAAGIESCASPLLQMSFETTMHFLEQARACTGPHASAHVRPHVRVTPNTPVAHACTPFLEQSTLSGGVDTLTSPSAAIVLGRPPKCGTGSFDLHAQLGPVAAPAGQWRAKHATPRASLHPRHDPRMAGPG